MIGEIKPTPGPWEVFDPEGTESTYGISAQCGTAVVWMGCSPNDGICNLDDALLIAEAGTVFHTTGLTPRQLADLNAEMVEALQKIIEMNQQWAIDQWGDASKAESMACVREARAALAKVNTIKQGDAA